ncbi:nuclear pore protein [Scheffersomyces xylosifermentans]|uniref:nuclear pore protein n=1 Tax=Scheffersomyces xylosifermentans TaxID=1304137 RepID=UPI00315CC2C0
MSKRGAADQLTRENYGSLVEEQDDDAPVVKASAEVLSKRKILKPKGRNLGSTSAPSTQPAFSGISNGFKANSNAGASAESNPFKLKNASSFGSATTESVKATGAKDSDKNNKIRALNDKFIQTINSKNIPDTIVDFTPIAQKYIEYYQKIQSEQSTTANSPFSTATPTPATSLASVANKEETKKSTPTFHFGTTPATATSAPTTSLSTGINGGFGFKNNTTESKSEEKKPEVQPEPVEVESDSDSQSDEDIKIEGPKFTLSSQPTVKNSPFTFDPKKLAKKNEKDSSDSESEIEIKGPTFTFNKPIKDAVFKLPNDKPATNPFSFGHNEQKKEEVTQKVEAKPAFSFGTTNSETSKPPSGFSFGSNNSATSEKKDDAKQSFSFGSNNHSINTPTIAFGSTTKEAEKPPVSFAAFTNPEKKEESRPFSFGTADTKESSNASKPLFSFNPTPQPTTESKDQPKPQPFSFGASKSDESATKPSAFSFGSQSSGPTAFGQNAETSKPTFNFGASNTTKSDAPSFNFSQPEKKSEEPKAPVSFGSNTLPSFNFAAPEKKEGEGENKPDYKFSFNPTPASNEIAKPAFSFGTANGGSSLFGGSTSATSASTFSFGGNKLGEPKESNGDEDKVEGEETGGDFKPIAHLASEKVENVSTGEEKEDLLYTKRTKLMLFDPASKENPYINKGVGDLKVLKDKDSNKSRILVRADGGLRVLLNVAISKEMSYTQIGNGSMVRIPTVNPNDTTKIETYILKVKTADDGAALLRTLNEAKV